MLYEQLANVAGARAKCQVQQCEGESYQDCTWLRVNRVVYDALLTRALEGVVLG